MELENRKTLSDLLRAAANQTISESDFWKKLKSLESPADDPIGKIAFETATHFWGNFHERNLLLMRSKPDRHQVQQGKEQLELIAEGLDRDWPIAELKRKLDNI